MNVHVPWERSHHYLDDDQQDNVCSAVLHGLRPSKTAPATHVAFGPILSLDGKSWPDARDFRTTYAGRYHGFTHRNGLFKLSAILGRIWRGAAKEGAACDLATLARFPDSRLDTLPGWRKQ
jgi:hypothetical protein